MGRWTERAFTIVEVIVAMLILSVVVSGAVVAVASSDRAETSSKAVADMHSIAEQAFERAHGDLSARSACDNQGPRWRATAAAHTRSASTAAASFGTCTVSYPGFKDEQGRTFTARMRIQPIDSPSDGTGVNDADGNLRDDYSVSSRVAPDSGSAAGIEQVDPVTVNGSVDWSGATGDLGTVRINVCGVDRPDRSLVVGGCAVADAGRTPIGNVDVTLTPAVAGSATSTSWNTAATRTITSGSNGVGEALAQVEPGAYRLTAPATFTDASGKEWRRFSVEPGGLLVSGSSRYDVNVLYVRATDRVISFCTQIMTAPAVKDGVVHDDGFEAYSTSLNYRGAGSPAWRSVRIDSRRDRGWACSKVVAQPGTTDTAQPWLLKDPLGYDGDPFVGSYALEIEQNRGAYRGSSTAWGMRVDRVTQDCTPGLAWNRPLDGTVVPSRGFDPANDRPPATGDDPSWYGTYELLDDQSHRICIRLEPKTFDRATCSGGWSSATHYPKGAAGAVPADAAATGKCFYVRTDCVAYCPGGARVCVANCGRVAAGTLSNSMVGMAAKPFGGPSDETVGCRPSARGAYRWYGWNPAVIMEGFATRQATRAEFSAYEWVGGGQVYYEGYTGHHGSGPVFYCESITFASSWRYLCQEGSNVPAMPGLPGFVGCRYHYNDCIQAELPEYPGVFVRGRMRDVTVNYDYPILPSINALRTLTLLNGIDRRETVNGWNPGTWWSSLSIRIAKVSGDPACIWDEYSGERFEWKSPVMNEVWDRIVDEPQLLEPPVRPTTGNVGTDRVAI